MTVRKPLILALLLVLALFFTVQIAGQVRQIQAYEDQVKAQEAIPTGARQTTGRWQASDLLEMAHQAQDKFTVSAPAISFNQQTGQTTMTLQGKTDQLLGFYQAFEKKAKLSTVTEMEIKEGDDGATLSIAFIW